MVGIAGITVGIIVGMMVGIICIMLGIICNWQIACIIAVIIVGIIHI